MLDWTDFNVVFRGKADYTLDATVIETITRQRKDFGGTLYFDRIWNSIGLTQASKSYPPRSNAELRSLWQNVIKTGVADEKKQAILFYILRDCKQPSNIDTTFARKTYLPLKYQTLVTGLWELDHGHFPQALEYLTDPSLSPEFSDDILLTLLTTSKCEDHLAMAYYLTVTPPLRKKETLEAYFQLLLKTSIMEAYHFTQKQHQSTRKSLFEEMLASVLEEAPSTSKAQRTTQILSLPMSPEEEAWFEEYLLHGEGSDLSSAKDSVITRRMALGRSLEGDRSILGYHGTKIDGVDWDDIRGMYRNAVPEAGS